MSLLNGRVNFKVNASNISSVASFISELDRSSIVLSANNSNDVYYDSSNALLYNYDTSEQNKAISLDIYENGQVIKPIVFSDEKIFLNSNVNIDGNFTSTQNILNDLGSSNYLWKDIYLSGHTINIGATSISSKIATGDIGIFTSNIPSTLIANRFNIMTEENVSNFSSIACYDDGLRLEYLDQTSNIIKSFPIGLANTSVFEEGSNQYYTLERYEDWFSTKNNNDFIRNGTSNRYIVNDVYEGDLNIMKELTVSSNITVSGDTTLINTNVYQMNNMYISNPDLHTALSITQNSVFDILRVSNSNNTAMFIANNTFTGINNENPDYNLDVSGTLNATAFISEASLMNNVNLQDKSTSHLIESSNLYFTHHRVDEIVLSSNLMSSNYLEVSSNNISVVMTETSNVISDRLSETSNVISDRLTETSNVISDRLTDTSNVISDRLTETSNLISDRITNIENIISDTVFLLNTDVLPENQVPNNLYYTVDRFDERFLSKTLDDFYDGTSNRYIINDTYHSNLELKGTLYASNLNVVGSITSVSTYTLQTESMIISTDSEHDVSLLIRQSNTSNSQILAVASIDGDGLYVYTCNLNDNRKGYVGINNSNPLFELDVNGVVRSTILSGDASQLYNINLSSIDTSHLKESNNGSNLYFTHERAGAIILSSNIDNSNYTFNSFIDMNYQFATDSNMLYTVFNNDNTNINTRITDLTTDHIAENTVNIYYTVERYDDRLLTKTSDFIHDGTSNKFIVNDVYVGDLSVSSNLYASNLNIIGNSTIFNTTTYITSNLNIITANDDELLPSLKIRQNGIYDIFELVGDETVLKIKNGGNVGIMTTLPENTLDINGVSRSYLFVGDASQEFLVNLLDRDTSLLQENQTNLWYTAHRAGELLYSSNQDASNYMINSYNDILNKTMQTSNMLSDTLNDMLSVRIAYTCNTLIETSNQVHNMTLETSNIIVNAINDILEIQIVETNHKLLDMATIAENSVLSTSNLLKNYLDDVIGTSVKNTEQNLLSSSNYLMINMYNTSNLLSQTLNNMISVEIQDISKFVDESSNQLYNGILNISNFNYDRIINLSTSEIPEASNLYFNMTNFMYSLQEIRNLDHITSNKNSSNKYITSNVYNGSLEISGSLLVSNLATVGSFTTLNTNVFQTENMTIDSSTEGPALKITQMNAEDNIFEAYDDNNAVMIINKDGLISILTEVPQHDLDVSGTLNSTYLAGDAEMTSNIKFTDRDTSMLQEGSNLYYTAFRTGTILYSSNENTSNYTLNTSNDLSRDFTMASNLLFSYIQNVSNLTAFDIATQSLEDNGTLGKFDFMYYIEKSTSNSMSIFGNSIIDYNVSNMLFIENKTFVLTSNIKEIEAATSYNLDAYFKDTSNNMYTNFDSRTYPIESTSNEIAVFNTLTSNRNTEHIVYNTDTFAGNLIITSNNIATYVEVNSNELVMGIINTSNTLQEYSILSCNQYTTHNIETSNYVDNYINLSSNTISYHIDYTDITNTAHFNYSSNTNLTYYINSSNELAGYWSNVAKVSLDDMILASNTIAPIINYDSNVISDRIQILTLDNILPGLHHQYIVNNVFNSNLNIPHNLVVASLHVQDVDMHVVNDNNEAPNQQLRAYVTEITSNAIIKYIQDRQAQ